MEEENALFDSLHVRRFNRYLNVLSSHSLISDDTLMAVDSGEDSGFITSNSTISSKSLCSDVAECPLSNTNALNKSSLNFHGVTTKPLNLNLNLKQNNDAQTQHLKMNSEMKLFGSYPSKSKHRQIELKITKQPESHHRARYMTEGSRGTIKDCSGRGYPVVQLYGYDKCAVKLECFIGHDSKLGDPHLFYQACEVNGKTQHKLTKVNGINIIELQLLPQNEMQAVIDCIGILKERNVDVERKVLRKRKTQRLKRCDENECNDENKKKSSHCRIVFRCIIPETGEILQTVSNAILCTQPLGTPEICKKSLSECDAKGGRELFIIGKNFFKDAKIVWKHQNWTKTVEPDKDFLHSTHLVSTVPRYDGPDLDCRDSLEVSLCIKSGGKYSDEHRFTFINSERSKS